MKAVILLGVFIFSIRTFAFPELVRHGYPNCTACHYSQTGGGVLTEYGRALSKEIVSTWGRNNEERFLYFIKSRPNVNFGGDFRAVNIERKPPAPAPVTERFIWMQRDLEAAATIGRTSAVATVGYQEPIAPSRDHWLSRRHWLSYQASDEFSVRAGRFYPAYGIYIPDHTSVIRRGLGWDQSMESYNLELSWIMEKGNVYLTQIMGRPDDRSLRRETGYAATGSVNLGESYKAGLSYYYGSSDLTSHHIFGPWGILGFTHRFFLLAQADINRNYASSFTEPQWGGDDYLRLNYEIFQGVHVFLTQEFSQSHLYVANTRFDVYGAGIQFFPRPHFEFQATYQKKYTAGVGDPTDIVTVLGHFYP